MQTTTRKLISTMRLSRPVQTLSLAVAAATAVTGLVTAGPAAAAATTYYVAPGGNNAHAGTSTSTAWSSVQYAVNTAPAGAKIVLAAGRYAAFTMSKINQVVVGPAARSAVVTGDAQHADVVTIKGTGDQLSSVTVASCVPSPAPKGSWEYQGSAGVNIYQGANNVTVTNSIIRDGVGKNSQGLPFGCFGIAARNSAGAIISHNDIFHNGYGIFIAGGGTADKIYSNSVHDNNVIIRNTISPTTDDFGAVGIGFYSLAPNSGALASGNSIVHNVGPSHDWGTDGGGFEIYNAGGVSMLSNTLANNDVAMETGGGTNGTCLGNVFAGNTVTGRTTGSVLKWSPGMVLRCAENMKIYSNTFNYFDWWTFDIAMRSFMPLGLKGMSIYSNTIRQHFDMIYCLEVAPKTAGYGISSNSNSYQGAFAKSWSGALLTKATFTALTGFPG